MPKLLFLQLSSSELSIEADLVINGEGKTEEVLLGPDNRSPSHLPAILTRDSAPLDSMITAAFTASQDGFYVQRHEEAGSTGHASRVEGLSAEMIETLRSLG